MASKLTGKQIFVIRQRIRQGYSVKELAVEFKVSESSIRLYTKAERARYKAYAMA